MIPNLEFQLLYKILSADFQKSLVEKKYTSLLFLSKLVYFPADTICDILEALGATKIKLAFRLGAEALYVEFPTVDILTFRGTEPDKTQDWRTILSFATKPFTNGILAHRGFVSSATALHGSLDTTLHMRDKSKPLLYSGHSMGGAIAVLFANLYEPSEIITFGQPRVFHSNSVIPDVYSRVKITRLTTTYDFVPFLPMGWQGYYHIGEEIKMDHPFSIVRPIYQHSLSAYLSCLLNRNIDVW